MAFSGGTFSRIHNWVTDKANLVKITASRFDAEMDGMATGLSTCILKDGTQTITDHIPFNGKKITGLGDAAAATDAMNRQASDARYLLLSGGTMTGAIVRPSFSAHKNGTDQTGISPSTLTKITFGTEAWDVGTYYDTATSRWTPPAGKVRINAAVFPSANTVDAAQNLLYVYKNGSALRALMSVQAGATQNELLLSGTLLDDANGTDYYEIYFQGNGAGNKTVSGLATSTYFQGSMA